MAVSYSEDWRRVASAVLSEDRKYRYSLVRVWDDKRPRLVAIGLNPSTADERNNDPTIVRVIGFADRWGYGGLWMLNLFAVRGSNPRILREVDDPVGPGNKEAFDVILNLADSTEVLCMWGSGGGYMEQDRTVMGWLDGWDFEAICLGQTKAGFPKHPLYLPYTTTTELYAGRLP
ncbi:MAG: DUF1643 domain-containing protein [Boseongicola sp.]|nr:DUF1643 domain-containing protein [Boseongicola sp.]